MNNLTEPKSTNDKDIKDFLLLCIKFDSITTWNKWRSMYDEYIDLQFINIEGKYLKNINLSNTDLSNANLKSIIARESNFSNSNLSSASLNKASIMHSNLSNCHASNIELVDAHLDFSNLSNSDFFSSDLSGASLIYCNLTNSDFSNADLFEANLSNSNLTDTNFTGVDLTNTIIRTDDINLSKVKAKLKLEQTELKLQELKDHSENLTEEQTQSEIIQLKQEAETYKTKIAELEAEKQKETDDIERIINFLAAMPEEISQEQSYLETRRSRFTAYGGFFLSFSIVLALGLIGNVLLGNKLELPAIDKISQYLAYALTVGFPMGISLLFYRQANLKSKEIDKINEKSILVKQVENALNSYNVLLSGEELKIKTISSIDRVIDKVFENNKKENSSEKTEDTKVSISDVQKILKMGTDISKNN